MAAFRFIHSADLHLGLRFGNFPDEIRGRLIEARHQVIARLAAAARDHGARHILLAGDTFDTTSPSDQVWRQAVAAMEAEGSLDWWIIAGNHDNLEGAAPLWDRIRATARRNIHVCHDLDPIEIEPGVFLLPAPLPRRRTDHDLTAWMAGCSTDPRAIRIGLAHGPVHDFSEEGTPGANLIPPDRAETARLDYLALGDWHGSQAIGPRCRYAGAPERDGFLHAGSGICLAVEITAPGALPVIETVACGQFDWADVALHLVPGQDPLAALDALLPPAGASRRNRLLRIRATGRASLAAHAALRDAADRAAPEFCYLALDASGLALDYVAADLDAIDQGGALRVAAETLAAQASDDQLDPATRRHSAGALNRLYGYLAEASE